MLDEVLKETREHMDKTIDALKKELAKVRTGRANLAMLDGITVDYYGTPTPLNQVASLQVADATLITIKPWDKSMLQPIEKAIIQANIGLTPSSDGELIRLPVPALTEERRKEIVKKVKQMGEEYKIKIRAIRRSANDDIKELEKEKEISEDDMKRGLDKVQELTDDHVKKVDELIKDKEKEIMSL